MTNLEIRNIVENLRRKAGIFKKSGCATTGIVKCFEESADTIEQLAEELKRLKDKQEQGLLIELPCKVGDTLYQKIKDGMREYKLIGVVYDIFHKEWMLETALQINGVRWKKEIIPMSYVGKIVFLTEAEAEEALVKMGGKRYGF